MERILNKLKLVIEKLKRTLWSPYVTHTLEHNFVISMLSWTDSLQAKGVFLRYSFSPVPKRTTVSPWTYIYWNLRKDVNLKRCWNIKALSPTAYGWNDNGLLYYSKTMDKALQVWYHWTHLDFWGIERMVFWVDWKTSGYPGREQLTSWRVGGLFPVHLSLHSLQ